MKTSVRRVLILVAAAMAIGPALGILAMLPLYRLPRFPIAR
jgi:hypothetical protein